MEQSTQQPIKPIEEQQPRKFDVNTFQELLKKLQERKEQGRNFQD